MFTVELVERVFNVQRNASYFVKRMSSGIRTQLLFDGRGALARFHVYERDRRLDVECAGEEFIMLRTVFSHSIMRREGEGRRGICGVTPRRGEERG